MPKPAGSRRSAITSGAGPLLLALVAAASCAHVGGGRGPAAVRIAGSDTMVPLTSRWAERFLAIDPGTEVTVAGGGSEEGIRQLLNATVDIAAASRPLRPEEVEALHQRTGTLGVAFRCALDGLSVYVHPDNPVRSLTMLQLKGIFTGRIGTWAKVGGPDAAIEVLIRQPSSGSFLFFRELVMDEEEYSTRATTLPTTAAIVAAVRAETRAIGFGGLAYGGDVRHLAVNGVEPTATTVRNGSYPLARYLYLYTARPPQGAVKRFIDWALSRAGQQVVAEVGYVPLFQP